MSATLQTLVVALVVIVAAAYMARRVWRTLRPRKAAGGCASGCGCGEPVGDADWSRTR